MYYHDGFNILLFFKYYYSMIELADVGFLKAHLAMDLVPLT